MSHRVGKSNLLTDRQPCRSDSALRQLLETLAFLKSGPLFAWKNMMLLSLRGEGGDWFRGEMVLRSARDAIFRC